MVYTVYLLLLCLGSRGSVPCRRQRFIFSQDGPVDVWGLSSSPPPPPLHFLPDVKLVRAWICPLHHLVVPRTRINFVKTPPPPHKPFVYRDRLDNFNFILLVRPIPKQAKSYFAVCKVKRNVNLSLYTQSRKIGVPEVQLDSFVCGFAKLKKATISFVMSVCPSVRMEQLGS
jgi:hypothetical protein